MRRPAIAGLILTTACLLGGCNVGGLSSVPVRQPPGASLVTAARLLSLRGLLEAVRSGGFTMLTGTHRKVFVDIGARTIVLGGAPRTGEFAQVVGEGSSRDRARYVALWTSAPGAVSLRGHIAAGTPVGFTLRSPQAHGVDVVLWSRTRVVAPLRVGEAVTVEGSGSAARGVVATSVVGEIASPSPSSSPTPAATPTPIPTPTPSPAPTPKPIYLSPGEIVGADDRFSPVNGDSPSGGQSQSVDGIPCAPSMSDGPGAYHLHVYLGIIVSGQRFAVPDQIGLYQPGPISNGYTNTATCYYYIHTHDASGMIHVESPSSAPISTSLYALKNALDVWGMGVSATNVGPFNGMVRTFVATVPLGTTKASNYTEYGGDPNALPLQSHEAIWLEVGPPYELPPYIPAVVFYTEY